MSPALRTVDDDALIALSGGHPLVRHLLPHRVAQRPGWAYGSAVGLLYDYWNADGDIVVVGPPAEAARLTELLAGEKRSMSLPEAAYALVSPGVLAEPHGWGWRWVDQPIGQDTGPVGWLPPGSDAEVADLLDAAFPDASIKPGSPRITAWAGIRDADGRLVACAADTTEAAGVGFVAAITTRPELRGQGLGRRVTAWTLDRLVEREGLAALWHYGGNAAAVRIYDALGLRTLPMTAADPA